jgi:hypothetical protein
MGVSTADGDLGGGATHAGANRRSTPSGWWRGGVGGGRIGAGTRRGVEHVFARRGDQGAGGQSAVVQHGGSGEAAGGNRAGLVSGCQGTTSGSFTGTRLLNVFDAAGGAKLPNDSNNAKLRVTVMVTGANGYQVALGWGELDPEFGAAPILLAYLSDDKPMGDKQGMARLVVPGDKRGGRYVSTVKSIELRDPGPALP